MIVDETKMVDDEHFDESRPTLHLLNNALQTLFMNATHVLEINASNDGTVIPKTVTLPNSRVGCAGCVPARASLLLGCCRGAVG